MVPRLTLGLVAAVPALALAGLMMANTLADPSPTNALVPLAFGAVMLAGVAVALAGLARDRLAWVPPGAALVIVGSLPLFLGSSGILPVLGAVGLVAVSRREPPTGAWRMGAGALAAAAVAAVAFLMLSGVGRGRSPSVVDLLLLAVATLLVLLAGWPSRAPKRETSAS